MILKIRKDTDPILRMPTEKVTEFDHELEFFIDNMIETMRQSNGIGLAAPQVGVSKKILVVEYEAEEDSNYKGFPLTVLVNPEIVNLSPEHRKIVEGCLSFPGVELLIERPNEITVKGQDRYGKNIEIKAAGLYSRVLQHEIDHLNCTLFIDHIKEANLAFIGTGNLGTYALSMLANDPQYHIKAVITGKVDAVSRKEAENPIKKLAETLKLNVIETSNINSPEVLKNLTEFDLDVMIMADFGQMLKKDVLNAAKFGILNIHPSLLPKHRGPTPVQQTILEGDKIAGVSLIKTENKMDAGGIISQTQVELTGSETTTILKDFLAELGGTLTLNSLPYYLAGDLEPIPQKEDEATFTKLFTKEDGLVDSNTSAVLVERKIRAFDVWPKVYAFAGSLRVQITAAHLNESGELVIDRVKPEGKGEMSYMDYLNGRYEKLTFKE